MSTEPLRLEGLDVALRTDALDHPWRYALRTQGRQARVKVLMSAELAARGGVGAADRRVRIAASAVELMHLASMVHDDVADDGDVRRGLPSLPARFGAPLSAAAGGLLFGRALRLFSRCGDEAVLLATEAALRMCEGQMREMRSLHHPGRTSEDYFEAVEGKSAGIFWLAGGLGGMLGRADAETEDALMRYGEALGLGHQIIDDIEDIRDLVTEPGRREGPHGNDLSNGNYTLPVIYAVEECPELAGLLSADAPIETVVGRLLGTRAIMRAGEHARRWLEKAKGAVRRLSASEGLLAIADEQLAALDSVLR